MSDTMNYDAELSQSDSIIGPTADEFEGGSNPILEKLLSFILSDNIAEDIGEEYEYCKLGELGQAVVDDYTVDYRSREEWRKRYKNSLRLARQIPEHKHKTFPFEGASNIMVPIITQACVMFNARSFGEIVTKNPVKATVYGKDEDGTKMERAKRVAAYQNYQLSEEMPEWESDTDKLLMVLPCVGTMYRKGYYNPVKQRTESKLLFPDELTYHYKVKLEDARTISETCKMHINDIRAYATAGVFLDLDTTESDTAENTAESTPSFRTLIEQCRYIDLDGDGYEEPYIVTVDKDTTQVLRIVANYRQEAIRFNDAQEVICIEPSTLYSEYIFLPSFDEGNMGTGFGLLLEPINESANSIMNQIIDAGTLANTAGNSGLIASGVRFDKQGSRKPAASHIEMRLGKFTQLDTPQGTSLRDSIIQMPFRGPNTVLFSVLEFLIGMGNDLASVKDVLSGETKGHNEAASRYLARLQQGLKVYNAIYKRIYAGLKKEYRMWQMLNYDFLEQSTYFRVLDEQMAVARTDFNPADCDVYPSANPETSSDAEALAIAEAIMENAAADPSNYDMLQVKKFYLTSLKVPEHTIKMVLPELGMQDDEDALALFKRSMAAQAQAAEMQNAAMQQDLSHKERTMELKEKEFVVKVRETAAKVVSLRAKAQKDLADADAAQLNTILKPFELELQETLKEADNAEANDQGTGGDVASPSGDATSA